MITTHTKNKIIFILDTKYNGKPIHEIIIKDQNENILKTNDALRFNNFDLFKNKKKLKLIKNKKKTRLDKRYIYVAKLIKRFIQSYKKNKAFSPNFKDGLENLKWINKIEKYKFHDAKDGYLNKCQLSNKDDLIEALDLGFQPLGDSLLTREELNKPETYYPLKLMRSKSLGHSQLNYIVPGEIVYHMNYPYKCGITAEVVKHHEEQAKINIEKLNIKKNSLVVDVGSNDGTLLNEYKKLGMSVLGVEPTNIAKIAKKGIDTIQSVLNESVAKKIIKYKGKAKLVTATNVFAHMSSLGTVMRAIQNLLENNGYFIFENHYMVDILKHNQYDTIYHEHIRNYSLKSLIYLFNLYNLKVIYCKVLDRYNGSIKVIVSKNLKEK